MSRRRVAPGPLHCHIETREKHESQFSIDLNSWMAGSRRRSNALKRLQIAASSRANGTFASGPTPSPIVFRRTTTFSRRQFLIRTISKSQRFSYLDSELFTNTVYLNEHAFAFPHSQFDFNYFSIIINCAIFLVWNNCDIYYRNDGPTRRNLIQVHHRVRRSPFFPSVLCFSFQLKNRSKDWAPHSNCWFDDSRLGKIHVRPENRQMSSFPSFSSYFIGRRWIEKFV